MTNQGDPYLDAGMIGWIERTAKENYWRVKQLCDLDDLVQDGFMCYAKCRARYIDPRTDLTGTKGERRWFQDLVKTTYTNHIHSLAAKHKGVNEHVVSQILPADVDEGSFLDRRLPAQEELCSFRALLAQAPEEIMKLIQLLATDGQDLIRYQRRKVGRRKLRETNNELYCRLLGLDPKAVDMVGRLKAFFG